MKKIIVILLSVILLLTSCIQNIEPVESSAQNSTEISQAVVLNEKSQKYLEDLNYMCDTLEQRHIQFYKYKDEFNEKKEEIIKKIPTINSDSEFAFELRELIAKLHDAHSNLYFLFKQSEEIKYIMPFLYNKFENAWHITSISFEYKEYLGYEVVAINNIPISDIYDRALKIIPHENLYFVNIGFNREVQDAATLKYLNIINNFEDDVNITLKKSNSNEKIDINVKLVDIETELALMGSDWYNTQSYLSIKSKTLIQTSNYQSFELNKDVYYIQYNICYEDEQYSIADFQKKITKDIENNKYRKVIIDLRYNLGGDNVLFRPTLNTIDKLERQYRFDVYTLIGNSTFSAGLDTALYIQQNINNTLVGSPTGGKPQSTGNVIDGNLKNIPVAFCYASGYFKNYPYDDAMTLYPDITIEQTFEDYVNGIDTVVEAVVKME